MVAVRALHEQSGRDASPLVLRIAKSCATFCGPMLSQCANPQCRKPFLRLGEGKLFLVETGRVTMPGESAVPPFVRARRLQRRVEHYWLCDACATQWTLVCDRKHGVALVELRRPVASADATAHIAQGAA